MKKLLKSVIGKCFLYTLLCLCFFSCTDFNKHAKRHQNRIDSIQVVTLQKDTVWIYAHGSGHINILPNSYVKEK